MKLTPKQEYICYPKSELEHANKKQKMHEVTIHSSLAPMKYTLLLPYMSTEWRLAQLLLKFILLDIISVLILLLIERSALIIEHSYEEVSTCTLTLKALL